MYEKYNNIRIPIVRTELMNGASVVFAYVRMYMYSTVIAKVGVLLCWGIETEEKECVELMHGLFIVGGTSHFLFP
jgi:hypothetical protein